MDQATTVTLGAIAGLTILLGLPVARLRNLSAAVQGFLNAIATGVLVFLLWDVLVKANEPVDAALAELSKGDTSTFTGLLAVFVVGLAFGLLSIVFLNGRLAARSARSTPARFGPGAALAADAVPMLATPSGRSLSMMIAIGLGLHNFSEGLAIGQAAVSGAISFALVLIVGFGLHNVTEGFGIAAPMASDRERPSWGFLLVTGLVGGGPTFLGTVVGYSVTNTYVFVLFLTLAAGALLYVIGEMFAVGRRMNTPAALAWGILLGFLAGYGTDLFLTIQGG